MYLYHRFPLRHLFSVITVVGTLAILISVLAYIDGGHDPTFLLEKGAVVAEPLWRTAFLFHILSASVCMAIGPALMVMRLIRMRRFHSFLGYLYLNCVLWIAAPTGLVISPASKGGRIAAIGFFVTGIAWWYTTWRGYQTIKREHPAEHAKWMIRSYSLALGAIWFRASQLAIAWAIPTMSGGNNYVVSVWVSLFASVLLSESSIKSIFGRRTSRQPSGVSLTPLKT